MVSSVCVPSKFIFRNLDLCESGRGTWEQIRSGSALRNGVWYPSEPYRPIYWNVWFPASGSIWVRIGVALLEEACPHWGHYSSLPHYCRPRMDVLSAPLPVPACLSAPILPVRMDRDSPSELYKLLFIMQLVKVSKTCHVSTFNAIFLQLPEQTK